MIPPRRTFSSLLFAIAALLGLAVQAAAAPAASSGVQIKELPDRLRIEINGELFSEYFYREVSRPYLYPIIAPGGLPLTRNWPMKDLSTEEHDHPHHRSWWYAHGDVNGIDFWSEAAKAGKTVHEKFLEIKSGEKEGVIKSAQKLVGPEGNVVCTDERTIRILNIPDARVIDFEITIRASHGEVKLGDTKEGTMAIRLAETMRLKPSKGNVSTRTTKQENAATTKLMEEENKHGPGRILTSEGVRDGETWGKRAKWCDYSGPVQGKILGVAIFDHPKNPRYPTWWHVRDYGLFAANPFGVHDFEKKPAGTGDLKIPAGEFITFKYRFYIHSGDAEQAKVAARYDEFSKEAK